MRWVAYVGRFVSIPPSHLSDSWDGIPSSKSSPGDVRKVQSLPSEVPGQGQSRPDYGPSGEGGHGNAAVLDLSVTEPGEGLVRTEIG